MLSRSVLSLGVRCQKKERKGPVGLSALLVVSLLPVSEINQRFRFGCGRTGGVEQERHVRRARFSCASQLEATPR
jgi:hypothetical protein